MKIINISAVAALSSLFSLGCYSMINIKPRISESYECISKKTGEKRAVFSGNAPLGNPCAGLGADWVQTIE